MNNTLKFSLAFLTGAAVGSVVTWRVLKTKYEQFAQAEIDSVKEVFSRRYKETPKEEEEKAEMQVEMPVTPVDYMKLATEYNFEKVACEDSNEPTHVEVSKPYVIPPEEYGLLDYELESLTYYADGVLVDENDDIIEDVDAMVGRDSLDCFGDYEDDSVFVRNDTNCTDYEILRDIRTYAAASNFDARLMEEV